MPVIELASILLDGQWDFGYLPSLADDGTPAEPGAVAFVAAMPVPAYWDYVAGVFDRLEIAPSVVRNPGYRSIDYKHEVTHEMYTALKSSLPYVIGVGYYRKSIDIPADWGRAWGGVGLASRSILPSLRLQGFGPGRR